MTVEVVSAKALEALEPGPCGLCENELVRETWGFYCPRFDLHEGRTWVVIVERNDLTPPIPS